MTSVEPLLTPIREHAKGLTDLCPQHLRQSIRHVQRNCDIECNVHEDHEAGYACKQPDRYDGERMASALASIPTLLAAVDAVLVLHYEDVFRGHLSNGCKVCGGDWPCPTVAAVTTALEGSGE